MQRVSSEITMTQLYLIRHAEAMAAIKGFIGDGGLSPLGVTQAGRLRDRLAATKEIEADVLIASTFPRAQQTSEIISLLFQDECLDTPARSFLHAQYLNYALEAVDLGNLWRKMLVSPSRLSSTGRKMGL